MSIDHATAPLKQRGIPLQQFERLRTVDGPVLCVEDQLLRRFVTAEQIEPVRRRFFAADSALLY